MNIFKYFKKRSENQFQINSSINTVEKNNVVYAAYYNDIGDGYSNIECTITTPFNSQKHSFSIDAKIPNKLIKDDKPVILPVSDEGKDFVVFAFPEEQKQLSVTLYTQYQVDLKSNSIKAIPHGEKISLSNNAKLSHSSNKYHSYSKPKAMELPDGNIIVAAVDSYSESSEFDRPDRKYVTAWILEKGEDLEFNVNEGPDRVVNRLLFKVDENVESSFQLLPEDQNNNVGKIIYSDSTSLFSLDVTESMIDNIREGKYVNNEDEECLFAVGKERCDQFDKKISTPFLTGKDISNLSAVNTKNGAVVAFLEDEQQLCLAKLTGKKGKKQIVHNYKEKIKSLQLSVIGENDIIVSAAGEKNITQSTVDSENLKVITTRDFPIDRVKTLGDFIDVVYNNPLKLTTSFPYVTFSKPKISSTVTTPLSTVTTEEITTKESTTTIEDDTTSAATMEVTTQRTTTKPKTTRYTTVKPSTTTVSTKQPTSTERATTTAETTVQTSTAQHTTVGQSTTVTTIPTTQPSKITTPAEETTISTNPTISQTAKPTSHTVSSIPKISSSIVSITSPLATEEITTRGSTTTIEEDTTSAATTKITTASTTQPTTTASPKTTTSTEAATTTAKTTVKTTIPTVRPTTSSKITTLAEKITVKPTTNQVTETTASTTKPTTKSTAKSIVRPTSRYTTGTWQDSTTVISTDSPKSTTTEMQSTAALGLTTLASTIGSAVVTTLGLVTQNVTNMITTNSMITDSSPNLNQTDISSNYEEKSLSTAEISAAVAVPIVAIVGMSYLIYRNCCRSNMRLPSDYTDDVGPWQRLRRYFRSPFNGQVPELQLDALGSYDINQVDGSEHEINQNSQSNSTEDLLKQNQNRATHSTFASASNANSEAGRSRSGSEKSTNSDGWDHQGDTNSVQYKEEDEISHKGDDVSLELNDVTVSNGVDQSPEIKVGDSKV